MSRASNTTHLPLSYFANASGSNLLLLAEKAVENCDFQTVRLIVDELTLRVRNCEAFSGPLLLLASFVSIHYPYSAFYASVGLLEVLREGKGADQALGIWTDTFRAVLNMQSTQEGVRLYHHTHRTLGTGHPQMGVIWKEFEQLPLKTRHRNRKRGREQIVKELVKAWLESCPRVKAVAKEFECKTQGSTGRSLIVQTPLRPSSHHVSMNEGVTSAKTIRKIMYPGHPGF